MTRIEGTMSGTGTGSSDRPGGSDPRGDGLGSALTGAHDPAPVTLGDLLEHCCGIDVDADAAGIVVRAVEYDSRRVGPGSLFVAVRGFVTDGHRYLADAAERGAAAALVEEATGTPGICEIVVQNTRTILGHVAHELHGRPSEHLKTHAITGTNGKTTTSYLVDAIMREAGLTTGVVGTLGYRVGDHLQPGDMTSPESLDLARLLSSMLEGGVRAVTMEVSSHALSLGRAIGLKLDTATFTNLSRDHLDFHGSFEEYGAAKRKLFELIEGDAWKPGAAAIVNVDDPFGRELAASVRGSSRVHLVTYGTDGDVRASDVVSTPTGTIARFETPGGSFDANLRLISAFNVMNALAATAVAVSQGATLEVIQAGLGRVSRVDGRLELVDAGQEFTIVVDYAHTPDALEKVLAALRELGPSRIITVFGCGGDRDRGKRPMMGEVVARSSDVAVVTSDNPRTEDPRAIIDEIVPGVERGIAEGGGGFEVIEDRRAAIQSAIELAKAGDIVLVAGKGHEDYQILGETKVHFDDREEARAAVRTLRGDAGSNGEGSNH
jgi:UDP-N-acetylmuramoyl-L-alanyl-D-glutamate--2,6-diaminopimelate ligase